jgi:hypothetical protein
MLVLEVRWGSKFLISHCINSSSSYSTLDIIPSVYLGLTPFTAEFSSDSSQPI